MSNYAWVLEVRPGYEDEYKKRHDEIWPEMVQMLSDAGLRNYNIFRHGLTLFGYFETDDLKKSIDHIVKSEVNKKSKLLDHPNVNLYDAPIMEISSTLIRDNIEKNISISNLVPKEIEEMLLNENKVY